MSVNSRLMRKFENSVVSDHDYYEENLHSKMGQNGEEVNVVVDDVEEEDEDQGRRTPRRNVRKPQSFIPEIVKAKQKRGNRKVGPNKEEKIGVKKVKKDKGKKKEEQFEVDYIFGKRPDKDRKGKFEYRVLWKGYPRSEASWEPDENLRFCEDVIQAYEQGQFNDEEEEMEVDEEGKNGGNDGKVTLRKNKKKEEVKKKEVNKLQKRSRSVGIGLHSKPKTKNKLLPTMRARASSVINKKVTRGQKSESKSTSKESSPALSHHSTSSSSGPFAHVKKGNLSTKKNVGKRSQPPQSTIRSAPQAKRESTSIKDVSVDANNIAMVESVIRTDIEGVGLIVKIVLKDGGTKKITLESFKTMAPEMLFEYYERALGLI